MRYNRGNIDSTIEAARTCAERAGAVRYIYGRSGGYTIEASRDPFDQQGLLVYPNGLVESTKHSTPTDMETGQ